MAVVQENFKQVEDQAAEQDELSVAVQIMRSHVKKLASMTNARKQYHHLVEEALATWGSIETEMEALRSEIEYHHERLDGLRDAALAANGEASQNFSPPYTEDDECGG